AARQGPPDLATVEATSLHTVSVLITAAALARAESRGCHRWRDRPLAGSAGPARHTVVRVAAGRSEAATATPSAAKHAPQLAPADNSNRPPAAATAAVGCAAAAPASHRPHADNSNRRQVAAAAAAASHLTTPSDNSNRKASA